jgi:hypothetical protein
VHNLEVDVCVEIMRNVLSEVGLRSAKKVSKSTLSTKNVKEKLEFAKIHKDWTVRDWEKFFYIDETRINYLCSDGISWCWICNNNNLPTSSVKQTVKYDGNSMIFWNYLTYKELVVYTRLSKHSILCVILSCCKKNYTLL